jgi:hypothetical protein
MATKSFEYSQTFNVGDVVQSPYSTCSRKVLSRVFIDEIAQYRFITQGGVIENNEFVPDSDGKDLAIYSTQELRDGYSKLWTKDKIVVKKGDVFTDVNGRIYIVESDDLKAWNIDAGTWAKLQIVGDVVKWDGRTLTEKTTVIGDKFSKYLG